MRNVMLMIVGAACLVAMPALTEAKSMHRHRVTHARTRMPAAQNATGTGGTMPGAYRY